MAIKYIGSAKDKLNEIKVKDIFSELKRDMGDVVEPISLHAHIPDLLEAVWLVLREVVIVENNLTRLQKETIGASVSESNRCSYCVDAHTIMIIGLQDKITAQAIVTRNLSLISDTESRNLVKWGLSNRDFNSIIVKYPPFTPRQAPEAIGTAVFFHYLNRMVFAFLGPTILPINISFLKGTMKNMAAKMFMSTLAKEKDAKTLPKNTNEEHQYSWLNGNKQLNTVFSNLHKVINHNIHNYISLSLCQNLKAAITNWDGSDEFLVNTSLERFLKGVLASDKLVAEVLFVVAFAPHTLNSKHFETLNNELKEDGFNHNNTALLSVIAWVSFEVATHIGNNLEKKYSYNR